VGWSDPAGGPGAVGEPELLVVADPDEAAAVAADRIATILADAVAARGRADWATTGGSAPIGIYRRLTEPPLRDAVPWDRVHVWWGDDRFVPRDHPLSNVLPFDDILLDPDHGVRIPVENLHPFRTGEAIGAGWDAAWAAVTLAGELRAAEPPLRDGWPVLDLILVGIGGDGHLLSVFPGSTALDSTDWALAIAAPTHIEPHVARVTLNPALLAVARHVLAVAHGASKAAVLGEVFGPDRDARRWPAQLARRPGATWILDAAAAARLRR
jgi:6-phosphogluconolactonase